jgi:hypothetical protein
MSLLTWGEPNVLGTLAIAFENFQEVTQKSVAMSE